MVTNKKKYGLPSDKGGKDFGIFMPNANGGWILSKNNILIDGSYELNKKIALLAEDSDFDFVLSMAKYRGYDGEIKLWQNTLDAGILIAAISEITSRLKVWVTIHTILQNPCVAAKMIATLDQISHGRVGLNIVTGSFKEEFAQMNQWPENLNYGERTDFSREWIKAIKALWREPSVTMKGKYFNFNDCVSGPKPTREPFLLCAGNTPHEANFAIDETDGILFGFTSKEEVAKSSTYVKEKSAEKDRHVRTYALMLLIIDESDAKAKAKQEYFSAGVDEATVNGLLHAYGIHDIEAVKDTGLVRTARSGYIVTPLTGSPETISERILEIFESANLDGMMLTFPDFLKDIPIFSQQILPKIRQKYGPREPAMV